MRLVFKVYTMCVFVVIATTPAMAQNSGLSMESGNEPLEITADGTLEWLRNDKIFIARRNALAQQGPSFVKADVLTAEYKESDGEGMKIWRVSAKDNVTIHSNESDAFGQDAVYDLDQGLATMTGNNLKMVTPDQTVTARDKFEYWVNDGRMTAIGNARVERPKPEGGIDILEADKVSAIFRDTEKGQRELHSLEAIGNVIITTPSETVSGAYGIYKAETNKAELTGGVKIVRGQNTLQGERAEVDLSTNTSKIFGSDSVSGKVKGVFYPGSEKKEK